ncbi:Lipoprotein signal peptidase [Actinidia chinensis var. chinensis]|uniref:Lipoprotein signal peptidase n=1 Tax=Actinidia chinensis var. chinensis TaxID=1590841 RepID=A0A2R6R9M1_ACTCC|nr:Lipoprotein signal peptidase [Actinidia chinensis var. chinensis]
MGSKTIIILVILFVSRFARAMKDPDSLDDFFRDYACAKVSRPKTGILYNISMPANFSGIEIMFIRTKTRNFWRRGANFSTFQIPPGILPMPFVKRFDLMYQNLGNWSSYYYNVPNYTLVTPIVGLLFYNATNSSTRNSKLSPVVNKDPILVHFPQISVSENHKNVSFQCARFGANGSVELTNMTLENACVTRDQGHFSIVVPSPPPAAKKREKFWKWWVVGFGVGIVGLVLVAFLGVVMCKFVKRKRIGQMERQSERSETLDTIWVGMSKMPSATGIRTQPVLESDYVP